MLKGKKNPVVSDEDLINKFSRCGGFPVTKEELLLMHQPLGGPKLTWEAFKIRQTPLGKQHDND